jgi:hypothetical protein
LNPNPRKTYAASALEEKRKEEFMEKNKSLVKKIVKENESLTETELLNWAMNQLFRAARTLQILPGGDGPERLGCDATAECILKRLVRTGRGYKLIAETNRRLLRGYRKPS